MSLWEPISFISPHRPLWFFQAVACTVTNSQEVIKSAQCIFSKHSKGGELQILYSPCFFHTKSATLLSPSRSHAHLGDNFTLMSSLASPFPIHLILYHLRDNRWSRKSPSLKSWWNMKPDTNLYRRWLASMVPTLNTASYRT